MLPTSSKLGPYEIVDCLGSGGMGIVYRAWDRRLERHVAIKVLLDDVATDLDQRTRFEREAKIVAALSHPNIVAIHDLGTQGHMMYAVMELLKGETLRDRLRRGPIPWFEATAICAEIAEGLAAAHERGIVHRDLKPENVIRTSDGRVKILDFGLACLQQLPLINDETRDDVSGLTSYGRVLGTLGYMSPEQAQGAAVDLRSDIFALGCVLYELLTGCRAFYGDGTIQTLRAILHDRPPLPSVQCRDLPAMLDSLVMTCLEKNPAHRFRTARELANQLTFLGTGPLPSDAESLPSIAVLPFSDISPDHDQAYFCEGLAEDLLMSLSRIRGLRVASRQSSFQFQDRAVDSRTIGDRLGVRAVLEGSVRKAGKQLRINVQLIDTQTGYQMWSERFDRELDDVFRIQDEISTRVVNALEVQLSGGELSTRNNRRVANIQAFDLYLRGRQYLHRVTQRDLEFAEVLFRQAIELDEQYASAWAGIAICKCQQYCEFDCRTELLELARKAAVRALDIDPGSAPAYAALGLATSMQGDRNGGEEAFRKAIRRDNKLFEAWYFYASEMLYGWGDLEQAAHLYQRAATIDPSDFQAAIILASIYHERQRRAEANAAALHGLKQATSRLQLNPDELRALYLGAQAHVILGNHDQALEWANRARQLDDRRNANLIYNIGAVMANVGNPAQALDDLEEAVARGTQRPTIFRFEPLLAPLREIPRFRDLVQRLEQASRV